MVELDSIRITADELNPTHRDTAIKTVIGGLFRRRFEYADEIPTEERNSHSPEGILVKARKGWFTQVASLAEHVIWLGLVEGERDIIRIERGIERFTSAHFRNRNHPRTTKWDIRYGNLLIDFILSRLDPQLIQEVILTRNTAQSQAIIQQVTV